VRAHVNAVFEVTHFGEEVLFNHVLDNDTDLQIHLG